MEEEIFSQITAIITSGVLVAIFMVFMILYNKYKAAKKPVDYTDFKKEE